MELRRWDNDKVIFEYECGSVKELVSKAIKNKISLFCADLGGADLGDANLGGADLRDVNLRGADLGRANLGRANLGRADLGGANLKGADLRNADLWGADLGGADLRNADLWGADLGGADLRGADLRGANLMGVNGNLKEIKSIKIEGYSIVFTKDTLQIGCKKFLIQEWKEFTDQEISNFDRGALKFWKKWKEFIFTAIDLSFQEV